MRGRHRESDKVTEGEREGESERERGRDGKSYKDKEESLRRRINVLESSQKIVKSKINLSTENFRTLLTFEMYQPMLSRI